MPIGLLNGLAKSKTILNNSATIHMLPFATTKSEMVMGELRRALVELVANGKSEDEDLNWRQQIFTLMEAHTIEIEFHKLDNPHVVGLKAWWDCRDVPILERMNTFDEYISLALIGELAEAYSDTRVSLPRADKVLANGQPVREPGESEEDFLDDTPNGGTT